MGKKEIKVETDWKGERKQVVYEDGQKVGEIKDNTILDKYGNVVGSIKHESGKAIFHDKEGNKLSETVRERSFWDTLFGSPGKETIQVDDPTKIGEIRKEESFWDVIFGEKRKVLHDEPGYDVEPLTRVAREPPAETGLEECPECGALAYDGYECMECGYNEEEEYEDDEE